MIFDVSKLAATLKSVNEEDRDPLSDHVLRARLARAEGQGAGRPRRAVQGALRSHSALDGELPREPGGVLCLRVSAPRALPAHNLASPEGPPRGGPGRGRPEARNLDVLPAGTRGGAIARVRP